MPMYWVSVRVGSTSLRGGRQYKVHVTKPGCPDKLGCPEDINEMTPVGREISMGGAIYKRCAKLWPSHLLED